MSEPAARRWTLDDLQTDMDLRTNADGTMELRKHLTIQIHTKEPIQDTQLPFELLKNMVNMTFMVGDQLRTISTGASTGRFVCVGDGIAPVELPSNFIIRRQTWEFFGKWQPIPPYWEVE